MFKSIHSIISTPFLFGGIVVFIINLYLSANLTILSGTFILIGMISYILEYLSSKNLKKLKLDGMCYEPFSVKIFNSTFLHAKGFYTFYIACEFYGNNQIIQAVKKVHYS